MAEAVRVDLAELAADLAEITGRIVWSTVCTTDSRGRPRCRVMHPVWRIGQEGVSGVVGTRRTPVKVAHVAQSPWVTCGYWSPEHDAAFVDCHVRWAEPGEGDDAWARLGEGYDPYGIWPQGPASPDFAAWWLTPRRIQVIRAADMARGKPTRLCVLQP